MFFKVYFALFLKSMSRAMTGNDDGMLADGCLRGSASQDSGLPLRLH